MLVNAPLVNMSANCFLVRTNQLEMELSKLIRSDGQARPTDKVSS